jgi:HlyD family secretion protein
MTAPAAAPWPMGRHLVLGALALSLLVFGLGGWSAFARISGAVIAHGTVEVEGNRQVVQHPSGGVVAAILARDGDEVEAGDVLLRFEGDKVRSALAVVEGQYFEIIARKNRLAAERDGFDTVAFDPDLVARADTLPEAAALLAAQVQQFDAHRRARDEEISAMRERMIQIGSQIDGMQAQRQAAERQAELLAREISAQESLYSQGLTRQTLLLAPQRELAGLEGLQGQILAASAEARARIAEIEIDIVRLGTELRRAAIAELRDLEFREIELRERRAALRDELDRLDLRAPASGIVYGSIADTLRAVVRPAEPVMFIVPKSVPLIVRARIAPTEVDAVRPGQRATLRFSAFSSRATPEAEGDVAAVSADALRDEHTGEQYYRVDIRLDDGALAVLDGRQLLPGMPVEAFIRTEERSPISYFVKPLADYFNRAFRET